MIYQSGYLTIKSYDQRFHTYMLGFDNEEVKYGFLTRLTCFFADSPYELSTYNLNNLISIYFN